MTENPEFDVPPSLSDQINAIVQTAVQNATGQPETFDDALSKVDPRDSDAALAMLDWLLRNQRLHRLGVLDGGGYLFAYAEPKGASKQGYVPGATQGDRLVDQAVEAQRASGKTPAKKGLCSRCYSAVVQMEDGAVLLDDEQAPDREHCAAGGALHVFAG